MITTAQLKNDTLQLFATAYADIPGYMTKTHREHARVLDTVLDTASARLLVGPKADAMALSDWDKYMTVINHSRRTQWLCEIEYALLDMDRTAHVSRLLTLVRSAN